jgi:galactitol-specific phosphotransferase system IIC component
VHPVSTALFLLGYGLAMPIMFRLIHVIAVQHRLAFLGHQIGMVLALLGWALRGRVLMAIIHGIWLIATRIWFATSARRSEAQAEAEA